MPIILIIKAMRDYNLLRTFVRHIFMLIWEPYYLTPEEQILRIQNVQQGKPIDAGIGRPGYTFIKYYEEHFGKPEDAVGDHPAADVLNRHSGIKYNFKEFRPLFLKDMVGFSHNAGQPYSPIKILAREDDVQSDSETRTRLIALGKYVGDLPSKLDPEDFDTDRAIEFMREIVNGSLSFVLDYTICGEKVLDIALRFLKSVCAGSTSSVGGSVIQKYYNAAASDLSDLENLKPAPAGKGFDNLLDTPEIDYTAEFEYQDKMAVYNNKRDQLSRTMFESFCDTGEYFAKGFIMPMLYASNPKETYAYGRRKSDWLGLAEAYSKGKFQNS